MNTAALRLASNRAPGWRSWPYGAHGNGNWLTASATKVTWPTKAARIQLFLLPRQSSYFTPRDEVKSTLRAWLRDEAIYEGPTP